MDTPGVSIRPLGPEDAALFREVRLRALRDDPTPFLSTHDEESSRTVEEVARRLSTPDPARGVLGAFRAAALVGTVGFFRHEAKKARHRATLWGMFVAREERRRGVGAALLEAAIARLRAVDDIEQVELAVVTTEVGARRLYLQAGFQVAGKVPAAMKVHDRRFDEELLVKHLASGAGPSRRIDPSVRDQLAGASPSECLPLLLEVARQQAERRRPVDLTRQLASDGFVTPSSLDLRLAHELDGIGLAAASEFSALLLSPLAPLGTCAVVSPTSQNRVVSTARGTEVVSDPTNVLALECARRLAEDRTQTVRLCTVQQVVRAQRFSSKPGWSQHFKMLALATAGAGRPDHAFEVDAIALQVEVVLRVIDAWAARPDAAPLGPRRATLLASDRGRPVIDRVRRALSLRAPSLVLEDGPLASGYYDGARVLLGVDTASGEPVNVSDTGVFDWVAKLSAHKGMRFVSSGMGLQLLPMRFGTANA